MLFYFLIIFLKKNNNLLLGFFLEFVIWYWKTYQTTNFIKSAKSKKI